MGWIFSKFAKKVKRLERDIAKDISQQSREVVKDATEQLEQIADKFDHIAQERITHARVEAESLETKIVDDIEKIVANTNKMAQERITHARAEAESLETKIVDDIEKIVANTNKMAQERITHARAEAESLETKIVDDIEKIVANTDQAIQKQVQEINRIRQETIQDLDKLLIKNDHYIENRINQLSFAWMKAVATAEFSLSRLETQVFQDVNHVIDRLEVLIDKTLDQIRNELKKNIGYAIPSPLDPCRKQLNLRFKFGASLSDIELYRLSECYELRKLNEETPVEKIREVYGQLELNAARMAALTKNASGLRKLAIEDWLKYGMLCEFWCAVAKRYENVDLEQLKLQSGFNLILEEETK